MAEPTIGWLAVGLSVFMMAAGPLGVLAAYRVYTPRQRARVDLLYHLYLCIWVFVSIVGTATLVWMVTAGVRPYWLSTVQTAMLVPLGLVQWRMHRQMDYTGWLDARLLNR